MAGRAIIADDDAFFRMALSAILRERLGFEEVRETESLDEALEALAGAPGTRLALFDLAMPGMADGAASLSAVRECHPDVVAAVVSGSCDREDVFLALRAGVHGFVPKSDGIDALTRALRLILDGIVYVPRFVTEPTPPGSAAAGPRAPEANAPDPTASLTPRQRDILGQLAHGRSNKEIARELGLVEGTVKIHVAALLRALGVPNRSAAAVIGARLHDAALA